MGQTPPTVADIRALKGVRQLTMLRVESLEEAEAAERAEIDMVSTSPELLGPAFREAAPSLFVHAGLEHGHYITTEDYLRAAFAALRAGADAVYCAASPQTIRRLADEGVPVCGHVGLIPVRRTWTGGFVAVGRTAESARLVRDQVRALEEAGAFAAEIEVVPSAVAEAIASRTPLVMISMGAGAGCDAQYLFSVDVLGENRGHVPRHSKVYGDLAREYDRLQGLRVEAYKAFVQDVRSGGYPGPEHQLDIATDQFDEFLAELDRD